MIDLSKDLDDAAVAVLIDHGLGNRFPAPCVSWRSSSAKNKEATQKCIYEGKRQVDEQLKNDRLSLENTLAREMVRRILDACPYVVPSRVICKITILIVVQFARPRGISPSS